MSVNATDMTYPKSAPEYACTFFMERTLVFMNPLKHKCRY